MFAQSWGFGKKIRVKRYLTSDHMAEERSAGGNTLRIRKKSEKGGKVWGLHPLDGSSQRERSIPGQESLRLLPGQECSSR